MSHRIHLHEIYRYGIAGVLSTLLDWSLFFIMAIVMHLYYQAALVIALLLSSILNYKLNKYYTFQNYSKKGSLQFFSFLVLVFFSLTLSVFLMHWLINHYELHKMSARMLTTCVLAVVNFFLTKYISFNHRLFTHS